MIAVLNGGAIITVPAHELLPGDTADVGAESIRVLRVDPLPLDKVRIVATLSDEYDYNDTVVIKIHRDAAFQVTRRPS